MAIFLYLLLLIPTAVNAYILLHLVYSEPKAKVKCEPNYSIPHEFIDMPKDYEKQGME